MRIYFSNMSTISPESDMDTSDERMLAATVELFHTYAKPSLPPLNVTAGHPSKHLETTIETIRFIIFHGLFFGKPAM